jgi:iron-sulfur cluster insertion protein
MATAQAPARPDPMTVTERAAKRIQTLIEREGNPNLKMRVSVNGGGCSGFQYNFGFDENIQADDIVLNYHGVTVLLDNMSLLYVIGSELDYVEEMVGSAFRIQNPNASSSCGCGSSFSI